RCVVSRRCLALRDPHFQGTRSLQTQAFLVPPRPLAPWRRADNQTVLSRSRSVPVPSLRSSWIPPFAPASAVPLPITISLSKQNRNGMRGKGAGNFSSRAITYCRNARPEHELQQKRQWG